MLEFPDDTKVGVISLDDIMAQLYAEGRKATDETAEEIIERLEAKNNYIPSSEPVRKEYAYVLLKEYRTYVINSLEIELASLTKSPPAPLFQRGVFPPFEKGRSGGI